MWNIHTYGFEMGNVNHGLAMVYENDGGVLSVGTPLASTA
jgi:hypothetical protein